MTSMQSPPPTINYVMQSHPLTPPHHFVFLELCAYLHVDQLVQPRHAVPPRCAPLLAPPQLVGAHARTPLALHAPHGHGHAEVEHVVRVQVPEKLVDQVVDLLLQGTCVGGRGGGRQVRWSTCCFRAPRGGGGGIPQPQADTLYPKTYTPPLHPTPCALKPTPLPTPCTLKPTPLPCTLYHKTYTPPLHPVP